MSDLARVCAQCGEVFESDTTSANCDECRPKPTKDTLTRAQRGYDSAWDRLSKRMRKKQPFCSDCNSTFNLQLDHSIEAWQAKAEGRKITPAMVSVVCGPCNVKRGQAKGTNPTWTRPRDIRDIL